MSALTLLVNGKMLDQRDRIVINISLKTIDETRVGRLCYGQSIDQP